MKYNPAAVATAALDTANKPYLGGEWQAYLTSVGSVLLGAVSLSAAAAGAWAPDPSAVIKTGGADLQIMAQTPIVSTAACVVTLSALDNSGTPTPCTLTATFTPPARALNQTFNFERGYASDLTIGPATVPNGTNVAITTDVATITTGTPHGLLAGMKVTLAGFTNAEFNVTAATIVAVPTATTFTLDITHGDVASTADSGTIAAVIGTKVTSVTGLISVANGAANMVFGVYQLPEQADYVLIEPTMEIDFNTKGRMAKGIDSGMNTDAYIKLGKAAPAELTIGSKLKDFVNGLPRFDGQFVTAMLKSVKDGSLTEEQLVFTGYCPTVSPKLPEGDGEATCEAKGKFTELLMFIAP